MVTLENKWSQLLAFYDLTKDDLNLLHSHRDFFQTYSEEIVDCFYQELERHSILDQLIRTNSTVDRLKKTQLRYWNLSLLPSLMLTIYTLGKK